MCIYLYLIFLHYATVCFLRRCKYIEENVFYRIQQRISKSAILCFVMRKSYFGIMIFDDDDEIKKGAYKIVFIIDSFTSFQ